MKTFTARQLNQDRQEIREAIQDGGCIVQFKHSDRSIDFESVMIPIDDYKRLAFGSDAKWITENNHPFSAGGDGTLTYKEPSKEAIRKLEDLMRRKVREQ
jgi:hypothetical protein